MKIISTSESKILKLQDEIHALEIAHEDTQKSHVEPQLKCKEVESWMDFAVSKNCKY